MVPSVPTSTAPRSSPARDQLKLRSPLAEPLHLYSFNSERLPNLKLGSRRLRRAPTNSCAKPSKPIPLPRTHIPRTSSELQLSEDMAAAEWREICMFQRLVEGMKERNQESITVIAQVQDSHSRQQQQQQNSSASRPKMITPQESPSDKAIDKQEILFDLLRRASNISDHSTTDSTVTWSSNPPKRHQQCGARGGFIAASIEPATTGLCYDDDAEDEIFSIDI